MSRVFEHYISNIAEESGCDYDFVVDIYDYFWESEPDICDEHFASMIKDFDWSARGNKPFKDILMDLSERSGYEYDYLFERLADMVCDPDDDGDWTYFVGVTMEHDW